MVKYESTAGKSKLGLPPCLTYAPAKFGMDCLVEIGFDEFSLIMKKAKINGGFLLPFNEGNTQ